MDAKLKKLLIKTFIFILSLSFAWYLIKSGSLNSLVDNILPVRFLAEFMAGLFYTSFLTIPIALAMFLIIAPDSNPIILSLLAGFGAVVGDLILVKIIRKDLSKDLSLASHQLHLERINRFLAKYKIEFITPLLGALVIISPFPDELGLLLMGISHLKYQQIAVISYVLNTAGILLIVTPINLLS